LTGKDAAAVELGRKGGMKGGKARARQSLPRSAITKKARRSLLPTTVPHTCSKADTDAAVVSTNTAAPITSPERFSPFTSSACHAPLMMISGFSMTFMLSVPQGNPMMDAFSCSTQKMLVAFSMFT